MDCRDSSLIFSNLKQNNQPQTKQPTSNKTTNLTPYTHPITPDIINSMSNLPTIITPETGLAEVMQDDLRQYQNVLSRLSSCWSAADSVDDVCKLSLTTIKVLEFRRKALLLPSGAQNNNGGNSSNSIGMSPYDE